MKKIRNKEVVIINRQTKQKAFSSNYFDLCLTCLETKPMHGFTRAETRKRIKIMDVIEPAIESGSKFCDLEDADFDILKQCVANTPFNFLSRVIDDFQTYIEQGGETTDLKLEKGHSKTIKGVK